LGAAMGAVLAIVAIFLSSHTELRTTEPRKKKPIPERDGWGCPDVDACRAHNAAHNRGVESFDAGE
jgi:hypothetical protein